MDNLEEKIQEVLKTETNYNFALTADRRKIMSREPPSNLSMQGPGPAAYQGAGLKSRTKTKQDIWKVMQKVEDEINKADTNEADINKADTNKADTNEADTNEADTSESSDLESSDDDVEKNSER
jgi:hypothetical protein